MIDVREVSFSYPMGGVLALDQVSLRIGRGERIALLGQNGSGKTTLVKQLNGLLRPTSGSVWIDGADIRARRVSELARLVGFAFQNPDDQIFRRSVADEIAFGPQNIGRSGPALAEALAAALEALGLTALRDAHPYTLGYAVRKLVSIAGIVAMGTPILVLDEPTTGQDATGTERVERLLGLASARGTTVVVVTHDMAFAARNFERAVVMSQARIQVDGPPREVFWRTDALAAAGIEPPPVVRLAQRLGGTRFVTVDEAEQQLKPRRADARIHYEEEHPA